MVKSYNDMIWNAKFEKNFLSNDSIQIWKITLPFDNKIINRLMINLSDDEIEKSSKFYFKFDSDTYISSRGVLRELISTYLKIPPKTIYFNYNQYGKPYLKDSTLQFNISHSRNCILLAFTYDSPIGVDVEYCKMDVDFLAIAQDFFSNEEYKKLLSLPLDEKKLGFYRCWTRKEAILKAMGTGLSFSTKQIEVTLLPFEEVDIVNLDHNIPWEVSWDLLEIFPQKDYIGAVAVGKKINNVFLQDWNLYQNLFVT